jgi:hypothetical protein
MNHNFKELPNGVDTRVLELPIEQVDGILASSGMMKLSEVLHKKSI